MSKAIINGKLYDTEKPKLKALEGFATDVTSELFCPTCGTPVINYWVRGAKPTQCQFCGRSLLGGGKA